MDICYIMFNIILFTFCKSPSSGKSLPTTVLVFAGSIIPNITKSLRLESSSVASIMSLYLISSKSSSPMKRGLSSKLSCRISTIDLVFRYSL